VRHTDVTIAEASRELRGRLEALGHAVRDRGDVAVVEVLGGRDLQKVLGEVLGAGAHVVEVTPRRETLEDLFMRRAL
jgi:ABC-2 type transport system ATP-binding protein